MTRRLVIPLLAGLALVATGGALAALLIPSDGAKPAYRGSTPPPQILLPAFALRTSTGELVRSRDLQGKIVLVTFLETRCHEACPIIASTIGTALRALTADERRDVVALAVSTQPNDDTPASVRRFLERHRVGQSLLYLIGTEQELRPVWNAFHIVPALDTGDADVHSAPVRIFDEQGEWVTTLHSGADLTADNLRHDLLTARKAS